MKKVIEFKKEIETGVESKNIDSNVINKLLNFINLIKSSDLLTIKDVYTIKALNNIKESEKFLIDYDMGMLGEFEFYIIDVFNEIKQVIKTINNKNTEDLIYQFVVDEKISQIITDNKKIKDIEESIKNYSKDLVKVMIRKILEVFDMNISTYINRISLLNDTGEKGLPSNFIDEYEEVLWEFEEVYKSNGIESLELIKFRKLLYKIRNAQNVKKISNNIAQNIISFARKK